MVKKKLDLPGKSFDLVNQSENHFISYREDHCYYIISLSVDFMVTKSLSFFYFLTINPWNPQKGLSPQKIK